MGRTLLNPARKVVDSGAASAASVPANGYKDVPVTFSEAFASAPVVTASLFTTSTSANYSDYSVVVANVTATGATLRVFNAGSTSYSPGVRWVAVG